MAYLGKRLVPPEGVTLKLGDKVVYEIVYDDGQIGAITTWIEKFDLLLSGSL